MLMSLPVYTAYAYVYAYAYVTPGLHCLCLCLCLCLCHCVNQPLEGQASALYASKILLAPESPQREQWFVQALSPGYVMWI